MEMNKRNHDKAEWRSELQRQIHDKERQKAEAKRREQEEELRLEQKLQRERREIEERERQEIIEKQKKFNAIQEANAQLYQDTVIRSKRTVKDNYRTPQVTTSKADFLGEDDYTQIERMLVRNAHNDLRNDFNLSLERMRQEFGMTHAKMMTQIDTLKKATDKEKEEKK
jgi:hypothetical protein